MCLQDLEEEQKDISEVCHNEHNIIQYHNYCDHVVSISLFPFLPPSPPSPLSQHPQHRHPPLSLTFRLVIKGRSSNYSASCAAKNKV